jgi:(E)-2-((N-methylformamido)methylene)succinate hydrolase
MTAPASPLLHAVVHPALDGRVPIVLLHGVGSNLTAWDEVAAALAGRAPVVRYDLRGHGLSPQRDLPYSLESFVDDHIRLLAALGIRRAHVVGFSLGGLIAQAVAIDRPETVDRLVVIGAVAGRTGTERARVAERLERARTAAAGIAARGATGTAAPDAARWFTDAFLDEHPDRVAANVARQRGTDPVSYAAAYEVLATSDLAGELHRISSPTLAMTGEFDVGSPPHMSELIAARVANGRAVVLPGYKHAVLDEIPQRVAAEIASFVLEGADPA